MPLLFSKSNQEVSTSRLSAFLISGFIHNDNDLDHLEASLHKPLNLYEYFGIDEIGSLKRYYFRDLAVIHIFLIFTWLFERFK